MFKKIKNYLYQALKDEEYRIIQKQRKQIKELEFEIQYYKDIELLRKIVFEENNILTTYCKKQQEEITFLKTKIKEKEQC